MTKKRLFLAGLIAALTLIVGVSLVQATHTSQGSFGADSITLTNEGDGKVSWSADGSANAFKLVWSKASGPTYPARSGDRAKYHSASSTSRTLTAFDGAGSYYVRVCEYLNGECGVYSNEVSVNLTSDESKEEIKKSTKKAEKTKNSAQKEKEYEGADEANKAASYFNSLFLRLKKVNLNLAKAKPSAVITPQADATLINASLVAKEEDVLTVEVWGLSFEVNASGADIDGGKGSLTLEDLETEDKLLIKGEIEEGVIEAEVIHNRSARMALVEKLEAEIASLLERIKELQEQLQGIR